VRAEFLWLGADPARRPGFGYMLCSAPRCLNQLIPQFVINARSLQQVAWALATSRAIYYTNKISPVESHELVARINARSAAQSTQQAAGDQPLAVAGTVPASAAPAAAAAAAAPAADNSSSAKHGQPGVQNTSPVTGSTSAPSQQVTAHLEYPDVAKVTAALASLLLSCLKVIGARHTNSPPQVTVTEMPIRAILSCLDVAVLVAGGNFTDSIFCSSDIVDSSNSNSSTNSSSTALAEAPGSISGSAGCSGDADSYCLLLPPGWGFMVGKALHTAGTLLDLHLNSWQPALLEMAPAAASAGEGDAACSSDQSCHDSFRLLAALSITHECLMLFVQLLPDASLAGSTEQRLTELALTVSEAVTAVQQMLPASQAGTAEQLRSTAQILLMQDGGGVPADEMNMCNYSDTVSDLVTASSEGDELPTEQLSLVLSSSPVGLQLSGSLISLGNALCAAMPTKAACNYPSCNNWEQPSEAQLVGGKGKTCSGCRVARYCCVEHQHLHWRQHKAACRALAEAAAAAAASVGPAEGSSKSKKKKKSSKALPARST